MTPRHTGPLVRCALLMALAGTFLPLAGQEQGGLPALELKGKLLEEKGHHREALNVFDQALALARSRNDRQAEARLSNQAGLAHFHLGDLARARSLSLHALNLSEAEGYLPGQATAHTNLAIIARNLGEIQQALASYRIAQDLWHELREPAQEARILAFRGELHLLLQQLDLALKAFNEGLILLQQEDDRNVRRSLLTGAASVQHEMGYRQRAIQTYRRALELSQASKDQAVILWRTAIVLRDEGDLGAAASMLEKARRLSRSQGERRYEAYALADLAHVEDLRGREAEAVRRFDEAYEIAEDLRDSAVMASVRFGRAEAERDRGRLDEAIASVEESIGLVESMRSKLTPGLRVPFFASRYRYYELYVGLLMDKHRRSPGGRHQALAFEAGERSRARSLLDEIAGRPGAAVMSLSEIQREVVDENSLLLAYQLGDPRSTLWVVSPGSFTSFDLPSREKIEEAARSARQSLSEGNGAFAVDDLSGMLLPAGIGPLGRKRLLIVPDGILHLVPFAALRHPARSPLMRDHEVVQLPSASVLGRMRQKLASRRLAPGFIAVLADPVFQRQDARLVRKVPGGDGELEKDLGLAPLQRLVHTKREAEEILKLFPSDQRLGAFGFAASRATAMSPAFASNRILHFATHNLVADQPDLSGLVLTRFDERGRPVHGFLSAREIYGMKLPVELVVLSACGTGLGREVRGEGVDGLTRAFLHAGAKRVVVSLWDVREGETAELMTRFYRSLRQGLSPAAALRSAQSSVAAEDRPPRAWAGFVLQGEPR